MNAVRLVGVVAKPPKHGVGAKAAWAFVSLVPDGGRGKSRFDVKAFRGEAEQIAELREGDRVCIDGHLENEKPKEEGGAWKLIVVADKVRVGQRSQQRSESTEPSAPDDDDIGF